MNAKIEKGQLTLTATLASNPPSSKSGKTKVAFSTNGFVTVQDDNGKQYQLSINLITKKEV